MTGAFPDALGAGNQRAQFRLLDDGRRAHFNDGPIDLIIEADGPREAVLAAYRMAAVRFSSILDELCNELDLLRSPAGAPDKRPAGTVARRMHAAVLPFARGGFITPMAAVAGAVAEEILGILAKARGLFRAYVNNGGDIALWLTPGHSYSVALVDDPQQPASVGRIQLSHASPVRGVATSGRHGRSFSLGIADAVTVLARTAATADAAATVIANAVDLPGDPRIIRRPARELQPDSDLAAIPVTVAVAELSDDDVLVALDRGRRAAASFVSSDLIEAAVLRLQGKSVIVDRNCSPAVMPGGLSSLQPIANLAAHAAPTWSAAHVLRP